MAAARAIEQAITQAVSRAEASVVAISRFAPEREGAAQPSVLVVDELGVLRSASGTAPAPSAIGSGVIIDSGGLILTQYLVVNEGDEHQVTTPAGNTYPATIVAADPRSGLAVLSVPEQGLPAISFGDASQLRKGQFVVVIGNPHAILSDGEPSVSWGIVANIAQKAAAHINLNDFPGDRGDFRTTLHHLGTLIQTDARLTFSSSGGALVDLDGRMVGLTTSAATIAGHEEPAGYAIPINAEFRRIIDVLKEGREVEYGLLGISWRVGADAAAPAEPGIAVDNVLTGGPADLAGLLTGDRITHLGDRPTTDMDRLQLAAGLTPPGEATEVRYVREGTPHSTTVRMAKYAPLGTPIVTRSPPAWRGIRVDYATALPAIQLQERIASGDLDPLGCVLVREVKPESVAWNAGVRPGTFISHVGEQRVTSPEEFHSAVLSAQGRTALRLTTPAVAAPGADDPQQAILEDR